MSALNLGFGGAFGFLFQGLGFWWVRVSGFLFRTLVLGSFFGFLVVRFARLGAQGFGRLPERPMRLN